VPANRKAVSLCAARVLGEGAVERRGGEVYVASPWLYNLAALHLKAGRKALLPGTPEQFAPRLRRQ
jgi:hypothetical protein